MRKDFIFYFFLTILSLSSAAQVPFFQQYALLRKNDPVSVHAIFQDKQGFIWFGTNNGLFRFDGKHHKQFTIRDSLAENEVTAIAQDSIGRIWVGHQHGKISIYDKGVFKLFEPDEGTTAETISDILFDRKGNLWFSTYNDGVYYFTQNRLYRLDEQEGMPDLYVYDLAEDAGGNVIAGTDRGIAICKLENKKVVISIINQSNGLPDNIIKKFFEENGDGLWMATEDAGVIYYDFHSKKVSALIPEWPHGPVSDFLIRDDEVWIACPQQGLVVVNRETKEVNRYGNNVSPGTTSVQVIKKDREGNIWAGSKSGVVRTPGIGLAFIQDPNVSGNTLAVTFDQEGNLWYSCTDGLIKRRVGKNGEVVIEKPLSNTAFKKYTVISLYTDHEGYIWAGLYGEGVLRINPVNGNVRLLDKEIRNGNVLNISGKGNVIWLATLGGGSKIVVEGDHFTIQNYGRAEGLSSDFIYQVFIDKSDRVWFATDGKGVDMLDAEGIHHYEEGLPSKIVYSMAEGKGGKIYANISGHGIFVFDGKKGFEALPASLNLRESEIHSMAGDIHGNIVLMHDFGMDIIDADQNLIRYFSDEAGLKDRIANLNATGIDSRGNLYFGTSSGIVKYGGSTRYLKDVPNPIIGSAKIFDHEVEASAINKLAYDQNNLTFNYAGLWYQNPENVYFSYKLDNYDLDWISTKNTSVTYSHLPPGSYVFRLKVSENENFTGVKEASLPFIVHPPFWKTPPFYMVSAFLMIMGGYAFIRFRERKLLHDKMVLEATVKRRTMEVQRQNDEIQAQNEEIMAQAEEIRGINENLELLVKERTMELEKKNTALEEYAFINAHKLRSPVASILGLVNLMEKTSLDGEGKEINKRLKRSAEELDDIVRSITKAIERGDKQYPFQEKQKL